VTAKQTSKSLRDAEARAKKLYAAVQKKKLIVPGKTESALSKDIMALAKEMFGVKKYWHKRIVRSGANTLLPYRENPPDLTLQDDDILFFDFGPVFADWEADLGATFVLGKNKRKKKLAADVAKAWDAASAYWRKHPDITCAQLYNHVCALAKKAGWEFGHYHCGHLVGKFPHEKTEGDGDELYIRADNPRKMRELGANGEPLRWILEIHFIDRAAEIGGFQEALLREPDEP
jgi:Xaa-Pro aminopeptidase